MQQDQIIKIKIDIKNIEKYFPLDYNLEGGLSYKMKIEKQRFEKVKVLLKEFNISNPHIIHEFCFIILWIEEEIQADKNKNFISGEFYRIWIELDKLKQYLQNNMIVSVSLKGETSPEYTLKEGYNIDRICDGLRTTFRNEFQYKRSKKKPGGLSKWKGIKMKMIKGKIMHYLGSLPKLDSLSLNSQYYIIGFLSAFAGYFLTEEDFNSSMKMMKHYESYQEYLIHNVKKLK